MKDKIIGKIIERSSTIWSVDPDTLSKETNFEQFEPKSVHYSQMTTFLEDEFDIEVPYMKFKRCKTIEEASEYILELIEE